VAYQETGGRKAASEWELACSSAPDAEFKPSAESISLQSAAVLVALQGGAKTTTELRLLSGALSPAARVLDLRKAGHVITTLRRNRQALYVLRDEGDA
jgi:Helix-turn-helix domain